MAEKPTLYVCHGDTRAPWMHPCGRVQAALKAAGIEYDKVIGGHGNPLPFLRKGSRDELREATGQTKLPAMKLADGTVLAHSRAIMAWIKERQGQAEANQPPGPAAAGQPEGPAEPEQPQGHAEPEQPQGHAEPEQPQGHAEPEQPQGHAEPEQPQG
jgi:Glutathione S-transferase, N-terminal domain